MKIEGKVGHVEHARRLDLPYKCRVSQCRNCPHRVVYPSYNFLISESKAVDEQYTVEEQ